MKWKMNEKWMKNGPKMPTVNDPSISLFDSDAVAIHAFFLPHTWQAALGKTCITSKIFCIFLWESLVSSNWSRLTGQFPTYYRE